MANVAPLADTQPDNSLTKPGRSGQISCRIAVGATMAKQWHGPRFNARLKVCSIHPCRSRIATSAWPPTGTQNPAGRVGQQSLRLQLRQELRGRQRSGPPTGAGDGRARTGKRQPGGLDPFRFSRPRQPLVRIDGALLNADGSDLWGRAKSDEPSLLECIGDGTLLLDKLDKAPKACNRA